MTALAPERVQQKFSDDDPCHITCHCTDNQISMCGLDVTDEPENVQDDPALCPLCMLACPFEAPACPWGCSCDGECGPA